MKKLKRFLYLGVLLSVLATISAITSCEIGLGEAVDTQAPVVSIDYPPESVIIREKFIVSGTCTDDMGVEAVKVTLNNTETGKVYGPFDADIKNDRWTITLNEAGEYNGFAYPDGRYSVDVYATDETEKKSGVASRAFDIDNTAPVLYLSKPLSVGSDTELSTFGKQVKLAGDISEDHATEYLSLHFKEYNNTTKKFGNQSEIKIENVTEMSSDSPLLIARYYSADEVKGDSEKQTLRDHYLSIYGSDADNNKIDRTIYCTIELSDNARVYQTVGDAGAGEGNKSDRYFINSSSFSKLLMSENTFNLSVDNMKKYINGTSTLTADQKKNVEKILNSNKDLFVNSEEITEKSSKFIINPDNSPLFSVEGYAVKVDAENPGNSVWNTLNTGSSFTVDIKSGKDSIMVKPNTIKISIVEDAPNGLKKDYVNYEVPELLWNDTDDTILRKTITVAKTDGFAVGKNYLIKVSGKDRDGNEVLAKEGNTYGFRLQTSSTPPTVKIGTYKDYISADELKAGITIPFEVETDNLKLLKDNQSIEDAIFVLKSNINNKQFADAERENLNDDTIISLSASASLKITKPTTHTVTGSNYKMSITLGGDDSSIAFGSTGIFKYTFYLTAIDSANKAGSDVITFYVDNEVPTVSGHTISIQDDAIKTLSKSGDSNKYLNGLVYVKAHVRDNYGLEDVKYSVYATDDSTDKPIIENKSLGKVEEVSFTVDTTNTNFDSTFNKIKVKYELKDSVGNITKDTAEVTKVFAELIDQTTDKPKIEFSNFTENKTKDDITNGTAAGNILDVSTALIGKIEDDDGLGSGTKIEIKDDKGVLKSSKDLSSGTFNDVKVPQTTGFYEVKVTAKDSTYTEATKTNRSAELSTWIAIDTETPKLSENSVKTEDVQYKNTGKVEFNCTISDDLGFPITDFLKVTVTKVEGATSTPVATKSFLDSEKNAEGNFVYEYDFTSADEANYVFEFVATDLAGKTSTVTRTISKDSTPPVFDSSISDKPRIIDANEKNGWHTVRTLQIKGKVTDNASGVKKVEYSLDGEKWSTLSGTTSFEGTLTNLKDGTTISLRAVDNAENTSGTVSLGPINIDNIHPTIDKSKSTIDDPSDADAIWNDIVGVIILNGENDISIKGTAEDLADALNGIGTSGLAEIKLKCGSSDFSTPDATVTTFTDVTGNTYKEWIATIPTAKVKAAFNESGSGEIWAQVIDKAGMSYEIPLVSVKYDSIYPEAKITSVKYKDTETNITDANKVITISGTTKDNQNLNWLKLEYTEAPVKASSTWTQYGKTLLDSLYSWSFDIDTEEDDSGNKIFTDGTSYVFRATVQDGAGNEGNSGNDRTDANSKDAYKDANYVTIKINQDSDRPVITVSNLDFASGKTIETMKQDDTDYHAHLYNLNKIYYSISDDDGIKKVEYRLGYGWKAGDKIYYTLLETPAADDNLFEDSGCITKAKDSNGNELKVGTFTAKSGNALAKLTISGDALNTAYTDENSWEDITKSDNFIISKDGPHTLIFRVTDGQNGIFISGAPDENGNSTGPNLQNLEKKSPTSKDTRIYVDVDMTGPELDDSKTEYASFNSKDSGGKYGEYKDTQSAVKFGGIYTKFKISLAVKDPNGVSKVELKYNNTSVGTPKCSDTSHKDGAYHTWTIENIPLTGVPTGRTQFVLELTDYAGNKNESNIYIDVDNTAATIDVDSHKAGDLISTAFILKGYITDGDSETKIQYIVDKNSSDIAATNAAWLNAPEVRYTGSTWRLNVDGKTAANDVDTHTETHKKLFVEAYASTEKIELDSDGSVVYSNSAPAGHTAGEKYLTPQMLYFHFLVTDKVGIQSVKTFGLSIDPQGDIPTIETTYPVYPKTAGGTDIDTLTGKVRVQGRAIAKGNNKIIGVYMQIDPNVSTSDVKFDAVWTGASADAVKANLKCPDPANSGLYNVDFPYEIQYIYDDYNSLSTVATEKKKNKNNTNDMYAIKVGTSASWFKEINARGELEGSDKNTIGIRVYAVDNEGNLSILDTKNDVFITLDAQAPQIGTDVPLYLYQYAWIDSSNNTYYTDNGDPENGTHTTAKTLYTDPGCNTSANETWNSTAYTASFSSVKYEADLCIKGEWWLNGSASDESGIKAITDDNNSINILSGIAGKANVKAVNDNPTWNGRNGYIFNYKVGNNINGEAGTSKYVINVTEDKNDSPQSSQIPVSLRYDNKAPEMGEVDISTSVVNSDGFYTFSASSKESNGESGFARAVVYFTRTSSKNIYDNYLAKGTDNTLSYANNSLHYEDNLYWKTATISSISGHDVTITAEDKNIHKGGLVKLGGVYYTITNYDSSSYEVTLDGEPSENLTGNIYFAIGNVIDTVGAETAGSVVETDSTKPGYGYYKDSLDNTDDYMIESTVTNSGTTKWTGSINSNNIPDGPIEINYVVFDKAGNSVFGKVENAKVENNAPRLAAVTVWCDFNNDNTKSDSECETYYYKDAERYVSGNAVRRATDVTSTLIASSNGKDDTTAKAFMTVKNTVKFIPEIVGGNGDLYYTYKHGSGSVEKGTKFGKGHDDNVDNLADNLGYKLKDDYGDSYIQGSTTYIDDDLSEKGYEMTVTTTMLDNLGNSSNDSPTWFEYNIYDSTDGCKSWADANYTTGRLTAKFKVALNIQYADTTAPKVFVKHFDQNSVYTDASGNVKGHIELEDDLTNEIKAAKKGATALEDDPKVSGIITIRGTAYDDIRLSTLSVQFAGSDTKGHSEIKNSTLAATYTEAGTWTIADGAKNLTTNGWSFTVSDRYNTENGHLVDWECNIDTSFIEGVAEIDRVFTIVAKDERGKSGAITGGLSSSTEATTYDGTKEADTYNCPTYQMDVVPYITKVTTPLSLTDTSNPTVYSRSALGHYPVAHVTAGFNNKKEASWAKEKVTIEGFNLVSSGSKVTSYEYTPDATENYSATTNGVSSLNNLNNDEKTYNQQPNGVNNDTLTDDVYFDVWQFNSRAGLARDNGKVDNLEMKINPANAMLGFAFSNSSEYFSMPASATSYSEWFNNWDYNRWNALAYDKTGNAYACTVGGDTNSDTFKENPDYADAFRFQVSRWTGKGRVLGNIAQLYTNASNKKYAYVSKNRYQSQSFATYDNGTTTSVYLAYYDSINNDIRIKAGNIAHTASAGDYGTLGGSATNSIETADTSKGKCNVIADGSANSLGNAGPYVSIGVTKDNRVVLVWYDNQDLWYTYTTKNDANNTIPTMTELTATDNRGLKTQYWAAATKIMDNAGKYCQLVVDSDNGVHVAAYDELNSSLNYVYIPTATNPTPANRKSAFVDSYLDVGENLTIDVAKDGDYQVPYIGYWGGFNEKPRYAYLYDKAALSTSSNKSLNGVDISTDKYTGVWECTTVPVVSSPNKNKINVGVWKTGHQNNGAGTLAYSTTETNKGKSTGTNSYTSSTATTNTGKCYGNGTKNGVLAYTISISGSERVIETAQLK